MNVMKSDENTQEKIISVWTVSAYTKYLDQIVKLPACMHAIKKKEKEKCKIKLNARLQKYTLHSPLKNQQSVSLFSLSLFSLFTHGYHQPQSQELIYGLHYSRALITPWFSHRSLLLEIPRGAVSVKVGKYMRRDLDPWQ